MFRSCFAALLVSLTLASPAVAQAGPRTVLYAPEPLRDALAEALAIELRPRLVAVGSEDVELVVFVEQTRVRVRHVGGGRTVQAPVEPGSDARTLSQIIASLAAEARRPGPDAPSVPLSSALGSPADAPPRTTASPEEPTAQGEETPLSRNRDVGVFVGVGAGGTYGWERPRGDSFGGTLRGTFGVRLIEQVRLALLVEAGVNTQESADGRHTFVHPDLHFAFEPIGTAPLGPVSVHFSPSAGLYASEHEYERRRFDRTGALIGFDRQPRWGLGFSFGGFSALSIRAADGVEIWIRVEFDVIIPDVIDGPQIPEAVRSEVLRGTISAMAVFD